MTEWRDIAGYEGLYQVSNDGQVKSLRRVVNRKGHDLTVPERILKQGSQEDGRLSVSLWKNNKQEMKKVHRLVAEAFIENPKGLPLVDHEDTNCANNHVSNLRWATHKNNSYNAKRHKDNKSGVKGVSWYARDGIWIVQMQINGKYKWFGRHEDLEFAELVAIEARNKYHGEFTNHGGGYVPKVTRPFK